MKERITITLDKDLIGQIDKRIDGVEIKNRSQEIELILKKSLGTEMPKKAVILAGGKGTRLRPLTNNIPKALIDIHGRTLTEHLFDLFKKYGIREVILSTGHMKEKIKNFYENGTKFGVNIIYVEETKALGTAGPLKLAKEMLNESFIVSNGDELKKINIARMFRLHKRKNALVTIALTTVDDPTVYGVARLDGSRIVEFVEKPKKEESPSNLINAGFYIIEPEVIKMIPEGFAMLEKEVFPKLAKQGKVRGFPFSGQWFDTGSMERLKKARKLWKDIDPYEEWE